MFTYTDIDGDKVVVKFTKSFLTEGNFGTFVTLSGGLAGTGPQTLSSLELSTAPSGIGVTVTATPTKSTLGDGRIHNLALNASNVNINTGIGTGIDVGTVVIDGDVRYVDAGDGDVATLALKSFTASSIGLSFPGIQSEICGSVGKIIVKGNFAGNLQIKSGGGSLSAKLDSLTIGGSILGLGNSGAGKVYTDAGIGSIVVGGHIIGGSADGTGSIQSPNGYNTILVKGSIIGGSATRTGCISGISIRTSLTILGSLIGGSGNESGLVQAYNGTLAKATIAGSIVGGTGDYTGTLRAGGTFNTQSTVGTILVKGSVIGGTPTSSHRGLSGAIHADKSIGKITVLGDFSDGNISAGVNAGTDGLFNTADDEITLGNPAGRTLGPVVLKSNVSISTTGHGIRAGIFTSLQAGGTVLRPGDPFANFATGFNLNGLVVKVL
jgi:hypothetical protein